LYCPTCGAQNEDDAPRCTNCGYVLQRIETPRANVPPAPGMYGERIPNYLVPAILTTLFCCLPLGIVSIVYAAQVDSKVSSGDRAGALESSRNAKRWAWISFGTGLAGIVLFIAFYAILIILGIALEANSGSGV
jgi:predicted secreted protein